MIATTIVKNKIKISLFLTLFLSSCSFSTDKIRIGEQTWMKKNLDVDVFRNGDPIPFAKTDEEWERAGRNGEPAWCYYNNDSENGKVYGKLYNDFAVSDARGLAPSGWRIPEPVDWYMLAIYLGGKDVAGIKLKHTEFWTNNEKATKSSNESGFSALPGGYRFGPYFGENTFAAIGRTGKWWTLKGGLGNNTSYPISLSFDKDGIEDGVYINGDGYSVRCIKE